MKYFISTLVNKQSLIFILLVSALMILFNSCVKSDKLVSPNEGEVYMAQSDITRSRLTIYAIDSPQIANFGASIAGFNGAPKDIDVEFEVDTSLIAQFNEDYAYLNYHYIAAPAGSYAISGLSSTIKKGQSDSDPLQLQIFADSLKTGLESNIDYCIPIKIKTISSGTLDTVTSVAYFKIDSLYIRARDIPGTLTVSKENTSGANATNGSVKLTDDDFTTKFICPFSSGIWMQLKLTSPQPISAYTLTTGNDHPPRDPKNWKFQGSNDGSTWTTLDERSLDVDFDLHPGTYRFELNQGDNNAYLYYRLVILANWGDSNFQLIEWRLLQYY